MKNLIVSIFFVLSCSSIIPDKPVIDKNLIIPGIIAEGFTIGERIDDSYILIKTTKNINLADILDIDFFSTLKVDSVIHINDSSVLFLYNGIITAIVGLKIDRRITSDAVLLSKGADNFILNYGNGGLISINKKKHHAYIYKELGIAIFSDGENNMIDMYLIFKK